MRIRSWSLATITVLVAFIAGCTGTGSATTAGSGHRGAAQTIPQASLRTWSVVAENARPGDPHWRIARPGHLYQIEGYADHTDVEPGTSFRLYVNTNAPAFRVNAFRMGWYGGDLARLVWTSPAARGTRQQGATLTQPGSLIEARWRPSITVPTVGWPPGSYLLRLDASTGPQSYVPIVIRSPAVAGKVVLISAWTSYQAYNGWGRYSLYGGPGGAFPNRARRVSFDRPISYGDGAGAYFQLELPLVAFAEKLGLNLGYITSVDLDLDPHALDGAVAVVSEAHDEYCSVRMRDTLTSARDHGTNIAFFGANAIFRKIRFEPSPLGADRIEVNYKVASEDPLYGKDNPAVTGNWPVQPDADPESSLIGQSYVCSVVSNYAMVVTDPASWIWRGADVSAGSRLPGLVGPEFDQVNPDEPTPHPIEVIARSPVSCGAPATYSDVSYYTMPDGAAVFASGTEDWTCALPDAGCAGFSATS
ncbi:MAG TPA: N,N-dimethylformamidase beta subunit family domain-containing protein, partial [Streptosporangiaceae bacterium]|nr:N,N-dimethylformamidase beta subunit family domain-containing protein [Streptosporangiaceae bacterium]